MHSLSTSFHFVSSKKTMLLCMLQDDAAVQTSAQDKGWKGDSLQLTWKEILNYVYIVTPGINHLPMLKGQKNSFSSYLYCLSVCLFYPETNFKQRGRCCIPSWAEDTVLELGPFSSDSSQHPAPPQSLTLLSSILTSQDPYFIHLTYSLGDT